MAVAAVGEIAASPPKAKASSSCRRLRRNTVASPFFPKSKLGSSLRVEIVLLDERRLEMNVGARLISQDLLEMVASHYLLRELQYFSLAFMDHTFYVDSIILLKEVQTVELFYLQAKNLITKGLLEVDGQVVFRLVALSLQASLGDYLEDSSSSKAAVRNLIPASILKNQPSIEFCEERVADEHKQLFGQSRGDSIIQYMTIVERLTGYGVHYYTVRDRANIPWFIGLSHRGIAEYDFLDKTHPRRTFLWKQLENLYFKERKFSVEVQNSKRLANTLNHINIFAYEFDAYWRTNSSLIDAIADSSTPLSTSRRAFALNNSGVYIWFAENQALCKAIWSMAIAQHQFYLDRKTSKIDVGVTRDLPDLAHDLSRSCLSLSNSSSSNLSHSGSHSSINNHSQTGEDSTSTESLPARQEMFHALQRRKEALLFRLQEKTEELRLLCLREGELTGELPPEYPLSPGEPMPVVRKRVGTSFTLDEALINRIINKQEETIASLELEYEIQIKITSAAYRLANEISAKKGLRRQRKISHQQAYQKLKDIEQKLKLARSKQTSVITSLPKQKKKPRPLGEEGCTNEEGSTTTNSSYNTSHGSIKDALASDGIPLSPNCGLTPLSQCSSSLPPSMHGRCKADSLSSVTNGNLSSPPSPSKGSSASSGSRSTSPRPTSGYIPSSVYTRSQYRNQHFPTLSTQLLSLVNSGSNILPRFSSGALYNIPQQRTSLASQSLEDLDDVGNRSIVRNNMQISSTDVHDRYGSLDRRRMSGARLESRSMEHLDVVPQQHVYNSQSYHYPLRHTLSSIPSVGSHFPPCSHNSHSAVSFHEKMPIENGYSNHVYSSDNAMLEHFKYGHPSSEDAVDGRNLHSSSTLQGHIRQYSKKCMWTSIRNSNLQSTSSMTSTVQKLIRTSSGHSYVETTFLSDQENIPPLKPTSELPPLKATNSYHRDITATEKDNSLHCTVSMNTGNVRRPFRHGCLGIQPLRATKSSCEILPYRIQNDRVSDAPLQSLSEAAKMKKEKEREWYETSLDSPISHAKNTDPAPIKHTSIVHSSLSSHNLSSSSLGSTASSTGSALYHHSEGSETYNSNVPIESPKNHMVISAGTFQPSREVTKPFEMADFYKYSTKFRRKVSNGSLSPSSLSHTQILLGDQKADVHSVNSENRNLSGTQQKGVYQPLSPLSCQPVTEGANACDSQKTDSSNWNNSLHQAIPAKVTTKRSATLV